MQISDKIDHFVVLMFENRSFDNILGKLPHPGDGERLFDGIPPGWANPSGPDETQSHEAFNTEEDVKGSGPSHHHESTLRQLVGPVHDWSAEFGDQPWKRVGERWASLVAEGRTNRGFVWDYRAFQDAKFPARVMGTWDDRYVPATWRLALEYGVCQRWFSSLPGMTQPNRLFSLCGTSFGHVDNGKPLIHAPHGSTVFARLDEAEVDWRFYGSVATVTPLITRDVRHRWSKMTTFLEQARRGELPAFSYLEPSAFLPAESQHPGLGEGPDVLERGDTLLATVYNALRSNEAKWRRTLLVVTWDEHGGFADHVPPPRACAPTLPNDAQNGGFDFTLLGARVPALVISPWVAKGRLDDIDRDHTCILSTARELYGLAEPFSARDASMPSLSQLLVDELPAHDPRPKTVKLTPAHHAIAFGAEKAIHGDEARSVEAMTEALDGYQRDMADAMIEVAAQEGVDLGAITARPTSEWTIGDLDTVARQLGPVLGAPE